MRLKKEDHHSMTSGLRPRHTRVSVLQYQGVNATICRGTLRYIRLRRRYGAGLHLWYSAVHQAAHALGFEARMTSPKAFRV